jgi:hypothetical protein
MVLLERLSKLTKDSMVSSGLEPVDSRLVAYCFNKLPHFVPPVFPDSNAKYFLRVSWAKLGEESVAELLLCCE